MRSRHSESEIGRLAAAADKGERRPLAASLSERSNRMRAAGAAASRIAAPIVARRGGGVLMRLKSDWSAMVGTELAAITWPEALGRDGALKARVAPGFALDVQHRAPLLLERVNLFFGRVVATRLALIQAPLPLPAPPPQMPPPVLSPPEQAALEGGLDGIADPELRAALAGLGGLILAGSRRAD
jgi:hypothetical protein